MATFNIGSGFNGQTHGTKVDSNGKIYVYGSFTTYNGITANRIIRLNPDGTIDQDFKTGTGFNGGVNSLDIDNNGKIYCGGSFGTFNGATANRIIRLNPDGSKDTAFKIDNTGSYQSNGFNSDVYKVLVETSTNKVYVGGRFRLYAGDGSTQFPTNPTTYNRSVGIIRINEDGSKDTTFATGYIRYNTSNVIIEFTALYDLAKGVNHEGEVYDIAIDDNGKIYAGGIFTGYPGTGTTQNQIIRFNTDGTKDTGFTIGTGFNKDLYGCSILVDDNNGVNVFTQSPCTYSGVSFTNYIRLTSGGTKTSFAISPSVTRSPFNKIAIYNDQLYVTVDGQQYGNSPFRIIKRYNNTTGAEDTGYTTCNFSGGTRGTGFDFDSEGDLYVGGYFSYPTNRIAKISTGGTCTATTDFAPYVTTSPITAITTTSISVQGNVVSSGTSAVTERGICYATTTAPTTGDTKIQSGSGTGIYTITISGLTAGTVYYARAYAISSVGIAYGDTEETPPIPPTVVTSGLTITTMKSISTGGNVTSDGNGTVSARGVCWNTTGSPTTGSSKTTNGTGTGAFTSSITGLTQNQIYYVRAYATNEVGTSYGAEYSTTIIFIPPVLSGSVISNYVHLTWTDVNPLAEHYQVWRLEGNGFPKTQLRSYWTLNELGGPGNYVDATGNYQDLSGTYGGSGISDANGKINGCWYNTGTSYMAYGGINLGSWARTPIVGYYYNSLSVNAWIKRNGSGYTEVIMSTQDYQRATNTYNGWMLYIDSGNHLVFQIRNDPNDYTPSYMTSTSTTKLKPNVWYMVTGTYNGMTGTYGSWLKTYINGVEDSNYNQTTPFYTRDWDANTRYVLIGSSMSTSAKQFRGYIDEISIFAPIGYVYYPDAGHQNQELTSTEIDTLYNYGNGIEYEPCGSGTTKTLLATVDAPDQYYDDYIASTACTYTYCVKALLDSYTPDLVTACSNDVTFNGSIIGTYPPSGLTGVLVANCAIEFNWINNSFYQAIILQNWGSWNTIATLGGSVETYTWSGTPTSNIFRVIGVVNGIQYISDQAICEVPPAVDSVTKKNSRCFGLNPQPGRIIVNFDYLISAHTYTFNVFRQDMTLYYSQSGMSYNSTFFVDNVPPACYYIELLDETCNCTVQTTTYCVESQVPFNVSGVKRVFISEYKDDLDWNNWSTADENYYINGYDLLKFQSVKIKEFINANTWYSLPTAEDSSYAQKMAKVRQGFVFNDVLTLSFTPSTYAKWLATGTLLEKRWVVVFEDNNSTEEHPQWWVFGYQNEGAKIRMYSRKSDFNNYSVEFSCNTGDKIITAIDYEDYVLPSIINS